MAEKKKMSVAEMLAAARKADSAGGAPAGGSPAAEQPAEAQSAAPADPPPPSAPVDKAAAVEKAAPKPVPKPGAAGRPSVADMMAMARANKGGAPAPASPVDKAAAVEKAAPKPKPAAAAAKPAAATAVAPERDTASILAAARKKDKPGPITKAEAAAKTQAGAATAVAKPKVVAPPMPAKPDYAKPKPKVAIAATPEALEDRRDFFGSALAGGFWLLGGVSALWTLLTVKFMFPNVLREPPSKFKVGLPDAFPPGQVQEKFKAQFGIWIVNTEYNGQPQIFALKSVCTHLGCTPNWLEAEQKFKCPCHGSGFYKDGINFEGPAPRPLERYAIRRADDGQIEVDKSRTFQEEMGAWADPSSFIQV
jgi:cytochrome b6-f complex iron-sulfur subunit